jgi:hypothetical protein
MDHQTIEIAKTLAGWLGAVLVTLGGAGWAVYTYFDTRRRTAEASKPAQGVPPEQVVEMFRLLLAQTHGDQSIARVASGPAGAERPAAFDRDSMSRFLALALRHDPSAAAIQLDGQGWAKVEDLIAGVNAAGYPFTVSDLDETVRTSRYRGQPRFAMSPDKRRIRANWGHSVLTGDA